MTELETMTLEQINQRLDELKNEKKHLEGTETEVYARIVGYYRAVKNWNRGKKEEYRARENFSNDTVKQEERREGNVPEPDGSAQSPAVKSAMEAPELVTREPEQNELFPAPECPNASYIYFYRKSCPNCPPVHRWLKNSGLHGREVDVDTDSGLLEAALFEVISAPTVVFLDEKSQETGRACNPAALDRLMGLSPVAGA